MTLFAAAAPGTHQEQLGLTKGNNYDLDLFHAERRADGSHFRVDTNFMFASCGYITP